MKLLDMISTGFVSIPGAGLQELWDNVLSGWITPIYIAAVAVFALIFLKDRAWMKLIGFVGIAAVVGVLVFAGGDLFGSKDSGLTKVGVDVANEINTVNGPALVGSGSFADLQGAFEE